MAIERNAGGNGGNYISRPGEYVVVVDKVEYKKTKKEPIRPMAVIHFVNAEDQGIAGYFVKDLNFHMKALTALKAACGLPAAATAEGLIGKKCGILVEMREPDEMGRSFPQIVGYGPTEAVAQAAVPDTGFAPESGADGIRF